MSVGWQTLLVRIIENFTIFLFYNTIKFVLFCRHIPTHVKINDSRLSNNKCRKYLYFLISTTFSIWCDTCVGEKECTKMREKCDHILPPWPDHNILNVIKWECDDKRFITTISVTTSYTRSTSYTRWKNFPWSHTKIKNISDKGYCRCIVTSLVSCHVVITRTPTISSL